MHSETRIEEATDSERKVSHPASCHNRDHSLLQPRAFHPMSKMRTSFQGLSDCWPRACTRNPDVFIRNCCRTPTTVSSYPGPRSGIGRRDSHRRGRARPRAEFSDNGTGMDRRDIEDFLSVIGSTAPAAAPANWPPATWRSPPSASSASACCRRSWSRNGSRSTPQTGATQTWHWVNHGGEDTNWTHCRRRAAAGTRVLVTLARTEHLSRRPSDPPDRAPLRRFPTFPSC